MERTMTVIHDPISKSALIECEGHFTTLKGPFSTRDAALAAAKAYCEVRWRNSSGDKPTAD